MYGRAAAAVKACVFRLDTTMTAKDLAHGLPFVSVKVRCCTTAMTVQAPPLHEPLTTQNTFAHPLGGVRHRVDPGAWFMPAAGRAAREPRGELACRQQASR